MKKLFLFLLPILVLLSLTHKDNAEFKGKVIDDQTHELILLADVVHISSGTMVQTDFDGVFRLPLRPVLGDTLKVSYAGYEDNYYVVQTYNSCVIRMKRLPAVDDVRVHDLGIQKEVLKRPADAMTLGHDYGQQRIEPCPGPFRNTESYDVINENEFLSVTNKPLSTFSIDVDGASFSNVRRFLTQGQNPPKDAVRIEELINYFDYDYEIEMRGKPFGLTYEMGPCPWNRDHQLLHVGIQGKKLKSKDIAPSNLVFLIDVSGSMRHQNKLPLLIESFKMLVNQLQGDDRVAIVTYAGNAGIVLEPTAGSEKDKIIQALERLSAGGSTAGAQGIVTAYDLAEQQFIRNGINRVILATDGDFNVGISSDDALEKLIEDKRDKGVFLNVLGFGMGNYKDSKMQRLANQGNGQHSYIDNIHEARKVFVDELQGTLFTIAKDVKIQIEFNPAYVDHYRLIGYENRLLKDQDFNNDKKDAGEIGAGHSVTALYEIVPHGVKSNINNIDPLKYQKSNSVSLPEGVKNGELATIKMRHKLPDGNKSERQIWIIEPMEKSQELTDNFHWSAAMACFGMVLRESNHLADGGYELVEQLAIKGKGEDLSGYRSEAINLIRSARAMFDSVDPGIGVENN